MPLPEAANIFYGSWKIAAGYSPGQNCREAGGRLFLLDPVFMQVSFFTAQQFQ